MPCHAQDKPWPAISASITLKMFHKYDMLPYLHATAMKVVASITAQPGISAFDPSLRAVTKEMLELDQTETSTTIEVFWTSGRGRGRVSLGRHGPSMRPAAPPPPPPPPNSVGPNFSHHKARVQAVGWFLVGTRKQGSRPFAAPTPPNRNGAGPKAGPAPPPPPPACPHTLTAGRHMVIQVPQGADAERQVCWDLGPAW